MLITEIMDIPHSKCKIYIDYEFAFVLYKGELCLYHLQVGEELSEDTYKKITVEVLPRRARLRCMNLLKSRQYTEKQLTDKLLQGGYSLGIIEDAIAYMKSCGYVNDHQYARDYIRLHMGGKSRSLIRNELRIRGIICEMADCAYEEMVGDSEESLEEAQILRWLEKKKFDKNAAGSDEKKKISASLYRKGFSSALIKKMIFMI